MHHTCPFTPSQTHTRRNLSRMLTPQSAIITVTSQCLALTPQHLPLPCCTLACRARRERQMAPRRGFKGPGGFTCHGAGGFLRLAPRAWLAASLARYSPLALSKSLLLKRQAGATLPRRDDHRPCNLRAPGAGPHVLSSVCYMAYTRQLDHPQRARTFCRVGH